MVQTEYLMHFQGQEEEEVMIQSCNRYPAPAFVIALLLVTVQLDERNAKAQCQLL